MCVVVVVVVVVVVLRVLLGKDSIVFTCSAFRFTVRTRPLT